MRRLTQAVLAALVFCLSPLALMAQFVGTNPPNVFRNLDSLRPPAGSKVAIVVFEDLGCPGCAHAHAIELDAAKRANVALTRYDFPIPGHIWTFAGAVCARYIQNKISPQLAEEYRRDVFAAQASIASKDDLEHFTQIWMKRHNQQMPFLMDPDGSLAKAVKADYDLGLKINLSLTPTVIVVTQDKQQVVCGVQGASNDPSQILPVAEAAVASVRTAHTNSGRSATSH